jgi:hypothetical protein
MFSIPNVSPEVSFSVRSVGVSIEKVSKIASRTLFLFFQFYCKVPNVSLHYAETLKSGLERCSHEHC